MGKKHGWDPDEEEIEVTDSVQVETDEGDSAEAIEAMRQWFFANFEDPAEMTPYCSAEGGYRFVHGGPYDAYHELISNFGGEYSEELVWPAHIGNVPVAAKPGSRRIGRCL